MEDPKSSRLDRVRFFLRENEAPITLGVGIGIGVVIGAKFPQFFIKPRSSRYPFGSSYNPRQPLPNLLLNEEEILRRVAAGILFDLFIQDNQLTDEFTKFAENQFSEINRIISK